MSGYPHDPDFDILFKSLSISSNTLPWTDTSSPRKLKGITGKRPVNPTVIEKRLAEFGERIQRHSAASLGMIDEPGKSKRPKTGDSMTKSPAKSLDKPIAKSLTKSMTRSLRFPKK